ncbi:PEP-CTERM sorting domain-containing protein [Candidatus Uabimicrobium amorphum]|uniref:Ice-binding protein C-terminal domain-containing protein n=1 Tax=Uabimicrobium amorphum TaxID=2596890 RepID=A0A5S9F2T1_UABAM|nr:PEP-CTERM sorting domain-containing protein [Candidatus Uabimicrobium amorphum]BBM83433.1 hypothetical protein UABAM_01785 [Candidatus Uabimicrobium amorphum]
MPKFLFTLLLAFSFASTVSATIITHTFTGTVNSDNGGEFVVGETITGTITVDTSQTNGFPASGGADFFFTDAVQSYNFSSGTSGHFVSGDRASGSTPLQMNTFNNRNLSPGPIDVDGVRYTVASGVAGNTSDLDTSRLDVFLTSSNSNLYTTHAIPTVLDVNDFDHVNNVDWFYIDGGVERIMKFTLTNITTSSVPEPSTYLLFVMGIIGIGFVRRKKS